MAHLAPAAVITPVMPTAAVTGSALPSSAMPSPPLPVPALSSPALPPHGMSTATMPPPAVPIPAMTAAPSTAILATDFPFAGPAMTVQDGGDISFVQEEDDYFDIES